MEKPRAVACRESAGRAGAKAQWLGSRTMVIATLKTARCGYLKEEEMTIVGRPGPCRVATDVLRLIARIVLDSRWPLQLSRRPMCGPLALWGHERPDLCYKTDSCFCVN